MPGFEVFGEEERQAINELFDLNGGILFAHGFDGVRNGVYRVREFEKAFAVKMGIDHAQAVSSCTAALLVAMEALGVGSGDEVIVPCFTFVATVEAVIRAGATPVVVDIDESLNMDPKAAEAAITDRTKLIVPVHMMGAPADLEPIMEVARRHDVLVLEDNAQGCGGTYKGKPLGTIADAGVYSFDAGKCMITGEGGMVVTRDKDVWERARSLHDHGHTYTGQPRGVEPGMCVGFNFRMTEIQGAIGLVQLGKLDDINARQRANKAKLLKALEGLPYQFRRINDPGEVGDAIIFYLENADKAERFAKALYKEGLGTKNLPDAVRWHFAKYWDWMHDKCRWIENEKGERWAQSEALLGRAVALPVMIKMTDEQIEEIGAKCLAIAAEIEG